MLKTLGKTTWSKIKIGEVFAEHGCWMIACKINNNEALYLAEAWNFDSFIPIVEEYGKPWYPLYKLPKSVQRLWKEE